VCELDYDGRPRKSQDEPVGDESDRNAKVVADLTLVDVTSETVCDQDVSKLNGPPTVQVMTHKAEGYRGEASRRSWVKAWYRHRCSQKHRKRWAYH
jgi:hypothetical protein